jgi:hypothetical protein
MTAGRRVSTLREQTGASVGPNGFASRNRTATCTSLPSDERAATCGTHRLQSFPPMSAVRRRPGSTRLASDPRTGRTGPRGLVVRRLGLRSQPGVRRTYRTRVDAFRCGASGSVCIPGGVHGRSPRLPKPDGATSRSPQRLRHRPQSQPAPSACRHGSHVGHTDAHHLAHTPDTVVGVSARRNRQRGHPTRRSQPAHRRRLAPPRSSRRNSGA